MAKMKINIDVSVDGKEIVVHIDGNATPAGGWLAAWEYISDSIKQSLAEREKEQADKAKDAIEKTLAALADLIGKTVEGTRQLCKDTGKDLPSAMIEVALRHAFKQDK